MPTTTWLCALALTACTLAVAAPAGADHNACGAAHGVTGADAGLLTTHDRRDFWRAGTQPGGTLVTAAALTGDVDLYLWNATCTAVVCSSSRPAGLDTCLSRGGWAEVRWVAGDPAAYVITELPPPPAA